MQRQKWCKRLAKTKETWDKTRCNKTKNKSITKQTMDNKVKNDVKDGEDEKQRKQTKKMQQDKKHITW